MSIATPSRPIPTRSGSGSGRSLKPAAMAASIDPIRVLRRHMLAIILSVVFGGVLGVAAYFAFYQFYPLYSGQVLFEVQPGLQTAGQVGIVEWTNDDMVYRIAQTETYMLTSRENLDAAMKDQDVQKTQWAQWFMKTSTDGRLTFDNLDAVDQLKKEIGAGAVRGSNLFSLSWLAHAKEDVPIVLNAVANAYTATRKARDRQVYDENLALFKNQATTTERELQDLTQQMKTMIKAANMTDLESVYRTAQAYRAQEITKQLAEVSSALSVSQSSLSLVNDQLRGTLEPTSMDRYEAEHDPSVMDLIQSIQFQAGEVRNLLTTHEPESPVVARAQDRLRAYEAQRDSKVKEIIRRNLEAKFKQYSNDVERYSSTLSKLEVDLEKLHVMLRDLAAEQSSYVAMVARRQQLEAKRQADMELINEVELMRLRKDASRVRMAQQALTPRELSFPKPEIIIPLGVLVVLGITIGIVFLRELLDQRVKSPSDLAVLPGANVLGSVPDLIDDPSKTPEAELVVRKHPMSVLAESYRQIASSLAPILDRNAHQTLLLVGGLPSSGTTTVATNMAATAAAAGKRALVVDANFRRPRLAQAMGVEGDRLGLADILCGAATLGQVIVDADGIGVIPAGTPANRISDRLNTSALDSMLAELRGKYDLVIFDTPPAVVSGDAMILANKVDAAVIVVRAHQEHRGLVNRMINRLSDSRCELLGVILNRPRGVAGGYMKKNYATMAEYTAST